MENRLQEMSRKALITEKHMCEHMLTILQDVRIYAICDGKNQSPDVIDLVDYFSNFPFDWKTEIKVMLQDAVNQYSEQLKTSEDEL